jgi:eukaryotic-like serine/threonine-protein kinase
MTGRYPRRFGKYVLLKPLAKGGMGEIYLAAGGDVGGFEKLCVIKKVITERADRAKAKRFLDEAKVVLRLSHSALVTTFDAGVVDGEFYIAMELVEGKDLREVWNRCVRTRQRIPLDVALHVVREVARGLAYVHGYGELKLVHRDVAPPNILLAYVGDVKLTDFGLARSILKQEHTAPGVVFGRAAYLAPEQARGEVADARTDVYTLGIVLWELLTGQQFLQLGGLDPAAALAIVRRPTLVPPSTRAPWITPALDQVVVRALTADRQQRFQSADELREAMSEVIGDIAPRADASRVAEFLRTIYSDTIDEERSERERFMKDLIPQFRAGLVAGEAPVAADEVAAAGQAGPPAAAAATAASPASPLLLPALEARAGSNLDHRRTPTPPALPSLGSRSGSPPVRLPGLSPGPGGLPGREGAPSHRAPPLLIARGEPAPAAEPGPAPVETTAPAGRLVGGCVLTETLVEGRLGSLHRAVRAGSTEEVSVRLMAAAAPDVAAMERLRDDVGRMARLGHPNIAAISEVGIAEDGRLYALLEPLAGADLGLLLRSERRLEAAHALEIATQVVRALGAGHALGVLHLRLEPELVLMGTSADQVKVLDFGLANVGNRPPPAFDAASIPYRAPEQLGGAGAIDARADVYAVAALLYELTTGSPPQAGSADPVSRKLSERVQSPRMFRPDMSLELDKLLLAALARDPERRPRTMAAFEEALRDLSRSAATASRSAHTAAAPAQDVRQVLRQAAFRVMDELLSEPAPPAVPASPGGESHAASAEAPPPSRAAEWASVAGSISRPPAPVHPSAAPSSWADSSDSAGAMLDGDGATPQLRHGVSRQAYALTVVGALAVAAALAWRLLH